MLLTMSRAGKNTDKNNNNNKIIPRRDWTYKEEFITALYINYYCISPNCIYNKMLDFGWYSASLFSI